MALPNVTFTLGQGGLGRSPQSFDSYSSMIAYYKESAAITAYSSIGNKVYNSIVDAEADGIVDTCADATGASVTETATNKGATGDIVVLTFTSYDGTVIELCNYTVVSGDSTATLLATSLVAAINANTYLTGFSAVAGLSGAYTVTAPKNLGVYPNTKSLSYTITGTVAITAGTFSGGTKSWLRIWHYQISEYFRGAFYQTTAAPLYFSIKFDDSANAIGAFNTQLKSDIASVASAWNGQARQIAILANGRTFATSTLDAIKVARTALFVDYIPAEFFLVMDNTATALASLSNLSALSDDGVTFITGQSASGTGLEIARTQIQALGSIGLALGIEASCKPSQSLAEVGAFNVSDGTECELVEFLNGTSWESTSVSLRNQLNDYGYVFLRKFPNATGTYFSNSICAITPASDYRKIEHNKTINKAVRNVYASILPLLNSRVTLKANGTLSPQAIAGFQAAAGYPLTQMFIDGDLSVDPVLVGGVIVSETEVVSTSGKIPITIKLVPVGIAEEISITIGYVASI